MFVIDITFRKRLHIDKSKSTDWIYKYLLEELHRLKIEKTNLSDGHMTFRNSFFSGQGKWHVMVTVNSGYFDFNITTETFTYSISTLRMFIFTSIFSVIIGITSSSPETALISFIWLYGMNWVISTIRHKDLFDKFVSEIQMRSRLDDPTDIFQRLHTD